MNLKEELNRLDRESIDNNTKYYDLKNLFEAIILTDEEKKELAKLIKDKEDPEVIYNNLAKKYGHDLSDLEIEEDYVHKTDEHTFNPLATAATLEVGDKVYDSTGEKVLEIVDKQMPNDWSVMLTIKDVATGDTWVQHSGHLALFELVVEGDHAEEVPEDIDIEFHPIDELTEDTNVDFELQEEAVWNCRGQIPTAKKIIIKDGVKRISNDAFDEKGWLEEVVIPDSVIIIGSNAFRMCKGLTSITIPDSVTRIGDNAFLGCDGLTEIIIPKGVTSMGGYAFAYCDALTRVTISNGVTSIGDCAFFACPKLTSITIPDSVTRIGDNAFVYCDALTSITIPDSVTRIGNSAFAGTPFTSITIPGSVTSIGYRAFIGCRKLTSVIIGNGVIAIGNAAFSHCSKLTRITIPDSVIGIGKWAFSQCARLTSVTIPASITSIGEHAFEGCENLSDIYYKGSKEQWEELYDKSGKNNADLFEDTKIVHFNSSKSGSLKEQKKLKEDVDVFQDPIDELKEGTNVDFELQEEAVWNCRGQIPTAKKIIIKDGVKRISNDAFDEKGWLEEVVIPDSVIIIGSNAFRMCKGLTSITIPDSVTRIGDNAFLGCDGLTEIIIPKGVTSMGGYAFAYCDALTRVTISNGVTSIGDCAFFACPKLTSITIPDSVTRIGDNAFVYCDALTSITIPDSVTRIGNSAFAGTPFTSITIPGSVTSIGYRAFIGCRKLTSVIIGNGVIAIGNAAFSHCSKLTRITIPDSVIGIGKWAFSQCARLTSVTIPASITSIGEHAFEGCENLSDIYYKGSKEQWEELYDKSGKNNADLFEDTKIVHFNSSKSGSLKEQKKLKEDVDVFQDPIDELKEGITTDGLKLPTNSKQVDSYVWRKIRPHDELTDDSSRFWVFDRSTDNGANAILVNKVEDIPDNAKYNFSLLDMDLYFNNDDYTWYVLDNSISDEELTESRSLNEGAGAGYSIKGTINNTKINSIHNMTVREESDGYVFDIELDADADFDDVSFYSYYYGDEIDSTKIKISKVSIYGGTDDTPLKESEIISSINDTKIGVMIGAGYSHTTFDGNIEAYADTSEISSSFDDVLEIEFDLTDKNAIEFIDKAVEGENISTEYAVIVDDDVDDVFATEEEAIEYAEEFEVETVKNLYVQILYTIEKFDDDVDEEFGDIIWRDGEYLESLNEDWRTGTFTREDLQSYRNDQIQKVLLVANSIKFMIRKHPEYSEIFFNLIDDLIDHLEDVKKESNMNEALVDEDKWTKEVLDILKTVLDKADDIRYEMKYATRGSRIKVNDINGLVSWLNDFNEDIEKASKELEERNDELTNGPQEENGQEENNNENQ
jgi:hypothetical protein